MMQIKDMEDFGAIEDDYINYNSKQDTWEKSYDALKCEPAWFLPSSRDNEVIAIKYKADYLYLKKKYFEAINCYNTYMNTGTNLSLTVKRECIEGICRSYLSLKCYCFALNYANELYSLSSTFDTHTAVISLLYDCSFKAQRFKDAVIYGKKLVLLHCSNNDAWLKLSLAIAMFYRVSLMYIMPFSNHLEEIRDTKSLCKAKYYSLQCKCEVNCDDHQNTLTNGTSHVIASLLYTEFHLKSIMNSSVGFALEHNIELQECIRKEIQRLCSNKDYIEYLQENIRNLFTGVKNNKEGVTTEFVDRASSKFANADHATSALEEFNEEHFEEKWFLFL